MAHEQNYIKTGEFAKLVGVSKQTLIHYDKIGLFSPFLIDDNNYRYYSFTQLERFTVIVMLKELDVPLAEIRDTMSASSPKALLNLLHRKKSEIDEKIERLNWCKRCIDAKINITEEATDVKPNAFYVLHQPDEYMIKLEINTKMPEGRSTVSEDVIRLFNQCRELGVNSSYAVGGIIPVSSITDKGFSYSHLYTVVDEADKNKNSVLDANGVFLVYYSDKGYNDIPKIAAKLLEYGRSKGYRLGDYIYEDTLLDDLSSSDYDNYLVKFSIEILGGK